MKKHIILLIAAMTLAVTVQAQEKSSSQSFKDGDNLFNAGIGFGYYGYGLLGNRTSSVPALTANYEIGVHEYFGIGPYVGYKSSRYRSTANSDYGFSIIAFGARGSFHYSTLLKEELGMDINDDKLDLYILAHFGFEVTNYSNYNGTSEGKTKFRFRPALGIRYYLGNNFAIFAEGGNGALSYFTIGLTIKM